MLSALPAPILLDIAIVFTALSWGLGFSLVDKKVYVFASLAVGCFVCLFGYSVESLGCSRMGGRCRSGSLGYSASLVCLKKATQNGDGLRVDLGNLHRDPHFAQRIASL